MDALTRMIDRGTEEESVHLAGGEQIEKILHGLLSSPCNFTPLLHYVVPVQNQDQRAFAEIWINPNGQDDDKKAKEGEKCCHVLIVFDIEGTGRFEAELFLREKRLDLSLFCPPFCASEIGRRMRERLPACMEAAGLQLGTVRMEELEKTRSLMDVFKFLPYKRMGVNVKI